VSEATTLRGTVVRVLADVLEATPEQLLAKPTLAVHNWDSLASLEALAALEAELHITLDLRDYHRARDVDDLVELVATAAAQSATTGH
jgi:acyl carrier protein